jgi:hypothetical protein
MIAAVREQGPEGVVAKRRDSLYEPGKRTGTCVKLRIGGRREFVIGGDSTVCQWEKDCREEFHLGFGPLSYAA